MIQLVVTDNEFAALHYVETYLTQNPTASFHHPTWKITDGDDVIRVHGLPGLGHFIQGRRFDGYKMTEAAAARIPEYTLQYLQACMTPDPGIVRA